MGRLHCCVNEIKDSRRFHTLQVNNKQIILDTDMKLIYCFSCLLRDLNLDGGAVCKMLAFTLSVAHVCVTTDCRYSVRLE